MTVLGFEERRDENGRRIKTDVTKDYKLELVNEFEAAESVARPFAYLIPPTFGDAVATLQRHGLDVLELREDIELDLETYKIDAIEKSPRRFEGHQAVELKVSGQKAARLVPAGTLVVKTAQPQGTLAVVMLEPRSEDGLATWNQLRRGIEGRGRIPGASTAPLRAPVHDRRRGRSRRTSHPRGRSRSNRPEAEEDEAAAASVSETRHAGSTASTGSRLARGGSSSSTP